MTALSAPRTTRERDLRPVARKFVYLLQMTKERIGYIPHGTVSNIARQLDIPIPTASKWAELAGFRIESIVSAPPTTLAQEVAMIEKAMAAVRGGTDASR